MLLLWHTQLNVYALVYFDLKKCFMTSVSHRFGHVKYWISNSDAGTEGGGGGPVAPQYFADQLTLFQPRGKNSALPLLPAPPHKLFSPSSITV